MADNHTADRPPGTRRSERLPERRPADTIGQPPPPLTRFPPMRCAFCDRPAERACTRCGRFFCPTHGGQRRVLEDGPGGFAVPALRVVCDACTPDEGRLRAVEGVNRSANRFLIGLGVVVFVGCLAALILLARLAP